MPTHRTKHSLPRRLFRWFRIALLTLVLLFSLVVLWCNYAQVPEFIARPIRDELRRNNVALEFGQLRLSGFRRVIAHDLRVQPVSSTNRVQIRVAQAELRLGFARSYAHPLTVRGIRIEGGELAVAMNEPQSSARYLTATNLYATIDFLAGDRLRIATLGGEAFGFKADVSGSVRNFSELRFTETPREKGGKDWQKQLAEVENIARELRFAEPPEVTIRFSADATNISSTRATVTLRADEGSSRWGSFHRLRLSSAITPQTNEPSVKANFTFTLQDLRSPSAQFDRFDLAAESEWAADMQTLRTNSLHLSVSNLQTRLLGSSHIAAFLSSSQQKDRIVSVIEAQAPALRVSEAEFAEIDLHAEMEHPLAFPTPAEVLSKVLSSMPAKGTNRETQTISGEWKLQTAEMKTPRARADAITVSGDLSTVMLNSLTDPSLGIWDLLRPFDLPWQLQLRNLTAGQATLGNINARGRWTFPQFSITEAEIALYNGRLSLHGDLDVLTRRLSGTSDSIFDYHEAAVLLDPPVQQWLEQFAWETPPEVHADLSFQFPGWTNSWERFAQQVVPTLSLGGNFAGRGSFRGIPLGLAQSSFIFSNYVWSLPELRITRPEGKAVIQYTGNVTNQEITARLVSEIDPAILVPAFDASLEPVFQFARFPTPPLIQAEIRGDLDDLTSLTARGTLSATNFFLKEQAFSGLSTTFFYHNKIIDFSNTRASRGKEQLDAPTLRVDLPGDVIFVTNAVSTMDPYIAMSIVGPDTYDAIDPYRFADAPTVRIDGLVPLRNPFKANLHFNVVGTEFTYWRFHLPELSGDVYWKGTQLSFSNVVASFYNGKAEWSAHFDIDPRPKIKNAHFSFRGRATNASLQPLVRDLFETTNRLEGTFSGELVINSAESNDIRSWDGSGKATLKDGYLWSIPIFGMFSPALDSIAPGLGSNPVSSGAGTFQITNSVIHTRDLQVRAPAFRLNYKGHVDLDGKLEARVDAELLRDAWIVGKLFSAALWPVSKVFEANVTGVLNNPKTSLRFVPKIVFAPFKALSAIGEAARKKEEKNKPAQPAPLEPTKGPNQSP